MRPGPACWPAFLLASFLAAPAAAQQWTAFPPNLALPSGDTAGAVEVPPPSPRPLTDYIAPAGWCPLRSGDEADDFGCDAGLAVSMIERSWRDYSAAGVAFVGSETVGVGAAWCRSRLCVGAGVAVARSDFGLDLDTAAPVVGATFSIGGLRE